MHGSQYLRVLVQGFRFVFQVSVQVLDCTFKGEFSRISFFSFGGKKNEYSGLRFNIEVRASQEMFGILLFIVFFRGLSVVALG